MAGLVSKQVIWLPFQLATAIMHLALVTVCVCVCALVTVCVCVCVCVCVRRFGHIIKHDTLYVTLEETRTLHSLILFIYPLHA